MLRPDAEDPLYDARADLIAEVRVAIVRGRLAHSDRSNSPKQTMRGRLLQLHPAISHPRRPINPPGGASHSAIELPQSRKPRKARGRVPYLGESPTARDPTVFQIQELVDVAHR